MLTKMNKSRHSSICNNDTIIAEISFFCSFFQSFNHFFVEFVYCFTTTFRSYFTYPVFSQIFISFPQIPFPLDSTTPLMVSQIASLAADNDIVGYHCCASDFMYAFLEMRLKKTFRLRSSVTL
jgi:hypothetical protein